MNIESSGIICEKITNQITRRLNEVESSLNSQIQDAIGTAIAANVHPSIQNTLGMQGRGINTVADRKSRGLQGSSEVGNFKKVGESWPISGFQPKNQGHVTTVVQ